MLRFPIFILLLVLSLSFSCSTPSWFPIKKGPPHRAKMKELVNKEVVIVDGEEFVKVLNPKGSEGTGKASYLYVPVDEYLAKKETFEAAPTIPGPISRGAGTSIAPARPETAEMEIPVQSSVVSEAQRLRRKVVLAHFEDRSPMNDETYGDWLAEELASEVVQRSQTILFVDYPMVKQFLEKEGHTYLDLKTAKVLRLLNEAFGVHALILGHLSGPYVFTTKSLRGEETAKAILKIDVEVVETLSGKTVKTLSIANPVIASREKGNFSGERAKVKAIQIALRDLGKVLTRELETLDWFCRVARVEGEDIYINAGRLTGVRIGDVMAISRSGDPEGPGQEKGKIRISGLFGIDASMGRLIDGVKPEVNDILRLAKDRGTKIPVSGYPLSTIGTSD